MTEIFCIAPFVNLSTTSDGYSRLCCQAKENHDFVINDKTVMQVFHSDYFKKAREDFKKNIWPNACVSCKNLEEKGISTRRAMENERWKHLNWNKIINNPEIHCFDLRLGNQCNLACVMCSPRNSTYWYNDYKNYDHLKNWIHTDGLHWAKKGILLNDIKNNLNKVEILYFSGGEPLTNKIHISMIDQLIENKLSKNISLIYDTNGTYIDKKWINNWKCFKSVQINFSLDATGDLNNYIRYPSRFEHILEKFELLHQSNCDVYLQCAIGAHNIFDFHNLEDLLVTYNFKRINVSIVHWPFFMTIDNLSDKMKIKVKSEYNDCNTPRMKKIVRNLKYNDNNPTQLCEYFTKIDRERNLNHKILMPWLYE